MFWIAGLFIHSVQGDETMSMEVELPMTASRIMRAKQWSKWTGQWPWAGCDERASWGRVCLYRVVHHARRAASILSEDCSG